jgi:hypothetical protein
MKDEYLNAIKIGEGQWIKHIDLSPEYYRNAEDIDQHFAKNENFWSQLESHCVAGCCGIDAFDLYPDEIKRDASQFPASLLDVHLDTFGR